MLLQQTVQHRMFQMLCLDVMRILENTCRTKNASGNIMTLHQPNNVDICIAAPPLFRILLNLDGLLVSSQRHMSVCNYCVEWSVSKYFQPEYGLQEASDVTEFWDVFVHATVSYQQHCRCAHYAWNAFIFCTSGLTVRMLTRLWKIAGTVRAVEEKRTWVLVFLDSTSFSCKEICWDVWLQTTSFSLVQDIVSWVLFWPAMKFAGCVTKPPEGVSSLW